MQPPKKGTAAPYKMDRNTKKQYETEKQPPANGADYAAPYRREPQPRETWTEIHTERPQKATIKEAVF